MGFWQYINIYREGVARCEIREVNFTEIVSHSMNMGPQGPDGGFE